MIKQDLENCITAAVTFHKGKANIVQVAKFIWENYENELRSSGNLFYTWQYDMRWAANRLRRKEILKDANISPNGIWELNT